ncbi:MAG: helix-turn-helix transcriptional regulator [Pseudomonadota bacterium]
MSDKHGKKSDDDANPMPAEAFRDWRKRLGLKQKDAADLLGLKKRMIQYYETGSRSGKHVSIPKSVRLACYALEAGVGDYDGQNILGDAPVSARFQHPSLQQRKMEPMTASALHAESSRRMGESHGNGQPPPLPRSEPESS